jgi:hypothetical protein
MRPQDALRASYGLVQLLRPELLEGRLLEPGDSKGLSALRLLGARDLLQAALGSVGGRSLRRVGGFVDVLHGLSMVALAVADRPRRPAATVNALVALAFAAGELR